MPYIGVFLTDLTFLDESAPDFVSDAAQDDDDADADDDPLCNALINFDKLTRLHERLHEIEQMQKEQYPFVPQSMVQAFLRQAPEWDEHEIYRVSKLREAGAWRARCSRCPPLTALRRE